MIRTETIAALKKTADRLGAIANGTEWFLFGSVDRDASSAADIDLLILCLDDCQADDIRAGIGNDDAPLPLHLSIMTYDEERRSRAVSIQRARVVLQVEGQAAARLARSNATTWDAGASTRSWALSPDGRPHPPTPLFRRPDHLKRGGRWDGPEAALRRQRCR